MKHITLLAALLAAVTFWAGCNREQTEQTPLVSSTGSTVTPAPDDQYWAKNNFDLQRVGDIIRRSHTPEEFERYLNRRGGIDNLDLNGDGYVDYISVREFNDLNDPNCRGLSMYTQYGPNLIQEIGTVMFYRDQPNYPGAWVLLRGDPRIYGDNVYYQTNWLDQSLQLASFLFGGNRDLYSSPYYYDNYPTWYETYEVVDTPVYVSRVTELYPQPVLVYTTQPEILDKIKIKSPNDGMYYAEAHAVMAKPTSEQAKFIKDNPRPAQIAKAEKQPKPEEVKPGNPEPGNPAKAQPQPKPENVKAQPAPKQPKMESPKAAPPKIARAERPRAATPMNASRPSHVSRPAPARPAPAAKPAGKPAGNPGGGGKPSGKPGGGGRPGGGGKPGGGVKPGGGGGKKH